MKKYVIIGGVAGGATTATRLRRLDEKAHIVLLERGEYISFANCGLPYYIGDVIKERSSLLVQTKEAMRDKFNIDVRTSSNVTSIDPKNKKIVINNETEETYDELIIATGSSPLKPKIPGIDSKGIYSLWTVPDMDAIKEEVDKENVKSVTVIGGGFIGLETAENLNELGLSVTLVEAQNQVMPPIDYDMAALIHENMNMNGINLILEDAVTEFKKEDTGIEILLNSGKTVSTDMVILSIGVRPNSELAREAGISLNEKGGIIVDNKMHTSAENIWAVGDVVEVDNYVNSSKSMIPLAGPANKQARVLANVLCGIDDSYEGTLGTSVAKVFDLTVASVGLNEKALIREGKQRGRDYEIALINQKSHAGYYPGATPLTMKMLFGKNGKIYGAQIVGQDGVDKRIDTIASTMRLNGGIKDLTRLELAYAPPFSSAKDPVNMLGFVAENILNDLVKFVQWDELTDDDYILDITEEEERTVWEYPGSHHIPWDDLRTRLNELPKDKKIVVYCAIGVRSYNVYRYLVQNGFTNSCVLAGGSTFYKSVTFKLKDTVNIKTNKVEDIAMEDIDMITLDCCGLQCPGPIMKISETLKGLNDGDMVKVCATDMGFGRDVESWCSKTGNTFVSKTREGNQNIVYIRKGTDAPTITKERTAANGKSLIVFDGDLDKAIAAFIIANGAASMGRPVTMFFTFWGLNILRKQEKQKVKKSLIEKMFGFMMPRGVNKLTLSKMNMMGMGSKMMKGIMKSKNVSSLEELMESAMKNGVKIIACTMSMDVMGIKKEELIDGIEYAGVATYLGAAEESDVNLFI
jgi:NADPH-dependent 2,4-dienoyl-CoA reductase/sulfur reductase-like enzyme/peroxiredoxin family protein/rhodanese-related sulfurtransferase/TusA-related sulfurtransferase